MLTSVCSRGSGIFNSPTVKESAVAVQHSPLCSEVRIDRNGPCRERNGLRIIDFAVTKDDIRTNERVCYINAAQCCGTSLCGRANSWDALLWKNITTRLCPGSARSRASGDIYIEHGSSGQSSYPVQSVGRIGTINMYRHKER